MESATLGRVVVTAKIENLRDLYDVKKGLLPDDQVRRVEVHDAVVDTGATTLLLPKAINRQSGTRRRMGNGRVLTGSVVCCRRAHPA